MHQFFNQARNSALCIAGVALAWVLFFKLNAFVFSYFEKTEFVNLVFISSGLRLVSVLLFDELGVLGLFFGLFNCLSHYFYFEFANLRASWAVYENMFIGDIFGIGIILTLFVIGLKLIIKFSVLPTEQESNKI